MDKLKSNALSLYSEFNQNLKKEFEKTGLAQHSGDLQGFQSNVGKALEELLNDVKVKNAPLAPTPPPPPQASVTIQCPKPPSSTSTLVFQVGKPVKDHDDCSLMDRDEVKNWKKNFPSGYLIMGESIKGDCRVMKTPTVFGWHPDGKLVFGNAAILLATNSDSPPELWECNNRSGKLLNATGSYKNLKFSPWFLSSFLLEEMKHFAKSGTASTFTGAIITFPLHYTCKQRVHLKEAAKLAGFQDVYLLSEEGLTAYYWFTQRLEQEGNEKYSKNVVIVTYGRSSFVMYRRLLVRQENGKQKIVVEAVHATQLQEETQTLFEQLKKMGIYGAGCLIPVLCKYLDDSTDPSPNFRHLLKNAYSNGYSLELLENKEISYFAVRAATLLSNNPKDLRKYVRNTLGTKVLIGVEEAIASNHLLPTSETCSRITSTIRHYGCPHRLTAYYTCGKDWMGSLWVTGVKKGAELKVTFELNWEGIWKVVMVRTKKENADGDKGKFQWIYVFNKADNWGESNGSLVLKTSFNVGQSEHKIDKENSKDDGTGVQNLTVAAVQQGVDAGGWQNVTKRKRKQTLKAIQPNEIVMNMDSAEARAEQDNLKENDPGQKCNEFEIEQIIVDVDPNLWEIEEDGFE